MRLRIPAFPFPRHRAWLGLLGALALVACATKASAQRGDLSHGVFVNGEAEQYLRVLQEQGVAPLYPWSIRSFSPREVRRLVPRNAAHPWGERLTPPDSGAGAFRLQWIPAEGRLIYNTGFPADEVDGPIWAGRGVTGAVQAGFTAEYGPISLVLAPQAFWTENRGFALAPNGQGGRLAFADARYPLRIDLPQRFGDGSYARLDPGQSTLRIDALGATLGVSTADQQWGPSRSYPLLLGSEAPGFPHAFLGTGHPVNVGIGHVHARIMWGRLSQSEYSPARSGDAVRMASGIVAVFLPRGVDGLEVGGARFVHSRWPDEPLSRSELTRPLGGIFSEDTPNGSENGLASVFARWVFPRSGFELFGEFIRDDYTWTLRDLEIIADQNSGYTVGFQKSWMRGPDGAYVVRGEVVNARTAPDSPPGFAFPLYIHSPIVQGHTNRGQPLGSLDAYWGAGSNVAVERYSRSGRLTLEWARRTAQGVARSDEVPEEAADALHTLTANAVLFRRGNRSGARGERRLRAQPQFRRRRVQPPHEPRVEVELLTPGAGQSFPVSA
jgi:hypothetical protein